MSYQPRKTGIFQPNFPEINFTSEEVENAKSQEVYDFNNLPEDKGTRWCGTLGELAFCGFLEKSFGWRNGLQYRYVAPEVKKSPFDFIIGWLKLDLKTVSTEYIPRTNYACNLDKDQYEQPDCNSYAFARYVQPLNRIYLVGWITKNEFWAKMTLRKKGDKLNKLVAMKDFYEIPINKLRPMSSLIMEI